MYYNVYCPLLIVLKRQITVINLVNEDNQQVVDEFNGRLIGFILLSIGYH